MIDKLQKTIEQYHMLEKGDTVTVGLSGGADSVALLYALSALQSEFGFILQAAHLNHGIRGEEADRDERFVRTLCKAKGIPLFTKKVNIPLEAQKSGEGEEECGRRVRYAFLQSVCRDGKIATAHNADDQMETMLFRLTRGASLKGVCGIPPKRGNIIRPLLFCTRAEIEAFCKANAIAFVTDSSNADERYTRNKIRKSVVPVLTEINPSAPKAFSQCAELLREDESLLASLAEQAVLKAERESGYDEQSLLEQPLPILRRAVSLILQEKSNEAPDFGHVEAVRFVLGTGKQVQTVGGAIVRSRNGLLEFPETVKALPEWQAEIPNFHTKVITPAGIFTFRIKAEKDLQFVYKDVLENALDCDKIKSDVVLRSRRAGDQITLCRRNVTKSLKKLFNEAGLLPESRNAVAVLANENTVLWVEGFGASKPFAADENSRRILSIQRESGENHA